MEEISRGPASPIKAGSRYQLKYKYNVVAGGREKRESGEKKKKGESRRGCKTKNATTTLAPRQR